MGGGMLAFFNAELRSGADLLLELSQFESKIGNADLIITGEGRIDRQSLMGKIPGKILEIGKQKEIPVIVIAGCVEDEEILQAAGFKGIFATKPQNMTLEEAMKKETAKRNIERVLRIVIQSGIKWSEESQQSLCVIEILHYVQNDTHKELASAHLEALIR